MAPAAPGGRDGSGGRAARDEQAGSSGRAAHRGRSARSARAGRDPGLQPERTRLAWRRTTLTYVAAALLAARGLLHDAGPLRAAVAMAVGLPLLAAFLAVAHRRMRALDAQRPPALSPRTAAAAASCVVALAVLGAAAHTVTA
ncbi:DUF202 domain-containing protein [Streptomyces sp. NPDC048639]|uniref:DUF202 domain-containing protein n=1 Tax=Streptomyces sp. NPDC048639 TaxID=3365581 RepID=UPI0037229169